MTLLYVFGWAFHKTYKTVDANEVYSNQEVAEQLQASVDRHYATQYDLLMTNNDEMSTENKIKPD